MKGTAWRSAALLGLAFVGTAFAGDDEKKPEYPPHAEVLKEYKKVSSTSDGNSLFGIFVREKDGQMMAELPRGYASQRHIFAMTVPTGELFAGLQSGDRYVYWKRYDKRIALIEENLSVRSTGDQSSKDSIENHFVDNVIIDVPIVCMGPSGQPVIDMDNLLVDNARTFYGGAASGLNTRLATVAKAKAFPQNVELAFEAPVSGGALKTFHYSISNVPKSTGYKPRAADERVGYFTTTYRDLGVFEDAKIWQRNINRWHLEKADPKLKVSPAKNPITYYIEHTVPVRYRRWVKAGAEYWNKAFEQVGISDAVVVHYQDKATGAHMEKDPEDVRYNFIRWLSNDIGTAIGPSRAHPITGQILDADVVLTDGWIRAFWYYSNEYVPEMAMEGVTRETLEFYEQNPSWDPRVLLAPGSQRGKIMLENTRRRAMARAAGTPEVPFGETAMSGRADVTALAQFLDTDASLCLAAEGKAREMASMGLLFGVMDDLEEKDDEKKDEDGEEKKEEKKEEVSKIDGIPEAFLGPMLADLVAHEVGHTLGLRHNFKASSLYTMAEINSPDVKGKKAFAGSVMDYIPVNINMDDGEVQGDYAMIDLGPYDMWAIEYGYGDKPEETVKRSAEPELAYSTDYDTNGTDPLARRYDFAKEPLQYAESRMRLVRQQREGVLDKFVKDGDSWGRARRGYLISLGTHTQMVSMMSNWLGGAFISNDRKGSPNARTPIEVVSAKHQRAALDFVIDNALFDECFGLTPELLRHMTIQKWSDDGGSGTLYEDSTFPIHDRIAGVQASALSMLMTPSTLRRIYDNEQMVPADEDALTLPEVMSKVCNAVWSELANAGSGTYSNRKPMISSLRRVLQQEHLERLIDLAMGAASGAVEKPVSDLARHEMRKIHGEVGTALKKVTKSADTYTLAHLTEVHNRIEKALDAGYTVNGGGGGGNTIIMFGKEEAGER